MSEPIEDVGIFALMMIVLALLLTLIGFAKIGACHEIDQAEQGTDAHDCYDNLTCDKGAVCYRLGEDTYQCRGAFPKAVP